MQPEYLFLRYAFPCAQVLLDKGDITKDRYKLLKEGAFNHLHIEREILENSFKAAIHRMKALYGDDYWSTDSIRDYFVNKHNQLIDAGDGDYQFFPKHFRNLCKVYKARVISRDGPGIKVGIKGIEKTVLGFLAPKAKPGDLISVHLGFAVEVLG